MTDGERTHWKAWPSKGNWPLGPDFQGWLPVFPQIASLTWPESSTSFCDLVYVSWGFSSGISLVFLKAEFLTLISVPHFSKFLETVFFFFYLPKTHNVMFSLSSGSIRGAVISGSCIGHCVWHDAVTSAPPLLSCFSVDSNFCFFYEIKIHVCIFIVKKLKYTNSEYKLWNTLLFCLFILLLLVTLLTLWEIFFPDIILIVCIFIFVWNKYIYILFYKNGIIGQKLF